MDKSGRIRDGALALGQAIAILFLLMANPAAAVDDAADAQKVVDAAKHTFNNFEADPEMTWFREHLNEAQGVLIAPEVLKAGFIFGGSGGNGVLLARDKDTGEWSDPAFYSIGSVTFGLQIGAQASELVMMVMTQKGLDSLLTTSAKLGADVAVAAGPVGAGAAAATADVFSFSRTKGIYGGLNVEGSVVKVQDGLNEAYYGKPVSPIDIMITRTVGNPQAASLVEAISHAGSDG
nr:lipid-binding SYLF domain-containing protein [Gammaproteobacteria bacterium]